MGKGLVGFAWESIGSPIPLTRADRQMLQIGREGGIDDEFSAPSHLWGHVRGALTFGVNPDQRPPEPLPAVAETIGALALNGALRLNDVREESACSCH